MTKLCCEREIFSNLLILAQGQQVPDAAMVLTPYVTTNQNTYFSMVCVFTNPTAPNNINATWLWTSYNNSNCCVDQGMSGSISVRSSTNCQMQFYCTPVNKYGYGVNGTINVNVLGK